MFDFFSNHTTKYSQLIQIFDMHIFCNTFSTLNIMMFNYATERIGLYNSDVSNRTFIIQHRLKEKITYWMEFR